MATNLLEDADLFREWRASNMTEAFFQLLSLRRHNLMEAWSKGHPGTDSPEHQASAVILSQLVDLSHDDVLQTLGIEKE